MAYETIQGTAEAGEHYTFAKGRLTFDPGDKEESITVKALTPDAFQRNDKTFSVTLSSAENATISVDTATVTISEPDLPQLSFDADKTKVKEGESATFKVRLNRASSEAVTVAYETIQGTAEAGKHYTFAKGRLTFDPGDKEQIIQVTTQAPEAFHPNDKTFSVELSNADNATISDTNNTATVTISEPDLPQLSFDADKTKVKEGESVTFTVSLSRPSEEKVTGKLSITTASASEGEDYNFIPSDSFTFDAGNNDDQFVQVQTLTTGPYRVNKTFTARLSSLSEDISIKPQSEEVTVTDLVLPQLSFVAESANVDLAEDEIKNLIVKLSRSSAEEVTVTYKTKAGTALADEHYVPLENTLTFAVGETQQTIEVTANKPEAFQSNEKTFFVELLSPEHATISNNDNMATVIISEPALPQLSFVADRTEVEEGESVTFTVSLSRPLLENVTGALSISSQNMKVDENYKFLPSATFTFPANETTDQTIEVKALQSETYSGDGAFTAILTSSRRDIDIVENNNRVTIEPAIPETVELTLEFIQNKS